MLLGNNAFIYKKKSVQLKKIDKPHAFISLELVSSPLTIVVNTESQDNAFTLEQRE